MATEILWNTYYTTNKIILNLSRFNLQNLKYCTTEQEKKIEKMNWDFHFWKIQRPNV